MIVMPKLPNPHVHQYELDNPSWWLNHHKQNVLYLCMRIQKLLDEPDNQEYRKFFHAHFNAVLNDFVKSAMAQSNPISDENTS